MNINLTKKEINKYLLTKEENILIDNIYNEFLTSFAPFINVDELKNNFNYDYYAFFLDKLEIDSSDHDLYKLSKKYELNKFTKLDKNLFLNNIYYKNIKLNKNENKLNDLTLKYNEFNPFECFLYKDIDVKEDEYFKEINNVGYFDSPFKYIELVKGDETWMSVTPHEILTMEDDINKVSGNILVLGLGIGYFTYLASLKENVKSIDVIEFSKDVITLFKNNLLNQFQNKNKINVIYSDALVYLKNNDLTKYDYIYIDLYHQVDDALIFYLKINNLLNYKKCDLSKALFWIEKSILSYIRRALLTLIEENINKVDPKIYLKAKNINDSLINHLYFKLKDININSKEELDALLKEDSLKELILGFK